MSAHTRALTTSALTEIRLEVPTRIAERVREALGALLPFFGDKARIAEKDDGGVDIEAIIEEIEADDDGMRYTVEEAFGKIEPGQVLRGLRVRENITQEEMAEALGVRRRQIAEMENGTRKISVAMAKRIAKAYPISHRVFLL